MLPDAFTTDVERELGRKVQELANELTDARKQHAAVAEVLQVIAGAPADVQPVFDAIVTHAARLCDAALSVVAMFEGGMLHLVAINQMSPEEVAAYHTIFPRSPGRHFIMGRAFVDRQPVHVADVEADPDFDPHTLATLKAAAPFRTVLGIPILRDGMAIGAIGCARRVVKPFTEAQIALVKSFADQAVIAIENTRLFEAEQASKRELTEALEQQTATADVLKVISRSALDVEKVLDALVESAARLCDAYDASIFQVFGDGLRLVAHYGQLPTSGPVGQLTFPLVRGRMMGIAVIDRRTIHVADALAEADEYPESRSRALQQGWRTALAVPLVHAGEAIGAIFIRRAEVRPFTERQIELVNTFADQAVIAIENTRLFEEVQARTRELAKTVEDLEIASQHKNQFVANMSHELRTPLAAILGYAELIQEGFYEPQGPKSLDALTRIRSNGKHLLGLIN